MTTKNISRTVVEVGRGKYNKLERKLRARKSRHWRYDEDADDVVEKADTSCRELRDSLSVLYRWLDSHIGERWDDVYSEWCRKFDRRSVMGDHVHRHFKDCVGFEGQYVRLGHEYVVDRDGILQHGVVGIGNTYWTNPRYIELKDWLNGRRLIKRPDDTIIWGRQMLRKGWDGKPVQFWGYGEPLSEQEWGYFHSFAEEIRKLFFLSAWELKQKDEDVRALEEYFRGRDQGSTGAKAKAQPLDPGSNPGGSTNPA